MSITPSLSTVCRTLFAFLAITVIFALPVLAQAQTKADNPVWLTEVEEESSEGEEVAGESQANNVCGVFALADVGGAPVGAFWDLLPTADPLATIRSLTALRGPPAL